MHLSHVLKEARHGRKKERHVQDHKLEKVYETLDEQAIQPVIPPRRNAKIKRHGNSGAPPLPHDTAIREIRCIGRKHWKETRRSLSETAIHRMKCCFGNKLTKTVNCKTSGPKPGYAAES